MTWKGDVDVDRIYVRRPKALCLPHLITLQYYSLLRFFVLKLATTSGSLQLCPEIINNTLIVPEFRLISLLLNVLVVLADIMQLGKLFNVFTTLLVNPNFADRIVHAITVACRTVTINRSVFASKFANWHFHCQVSQI